MAIEINPIENHREREKGVIVYPVYSRRSGGLSVGINLFPDKKVCNFDCPYCEVFPFKNNSLFSLTQMEEDLKNAIQNAINQNIPIKDICFSGNGESTLSPYFFDAMVLVDKIRNDLCLESNIVLITNGTGLLNEDVFSFLRKNANEINLDIWLKLDAATCEWYEKINRSNVNFNQLLSKIKDFSLIAPFTIQTMLCKIDGNPPYPEEVNAWNNLVLQLCSNGKIKKIQIYGKARPAPEDPLSSALENEELDKRGESLKELFKGKGITVPVDVYY